MHRARQVQHPQLEANVIRWIMVEQKAEISVSTSDVVDIAVLMSARCKNGDRPKSVYYVYLLIEVWKWRPCKIDILGILIDQASKFICAPTNEIQPNDECSDVTGTQ